MDEMKERPILFSGPMVRAILSGQKTQTRRILRRQPRPHMTHFINGSRGWFARSDDFDLHRDDGAKVGLAYQQEVEPRRCPYGVPGDRLWVRETWAARGNEDGAPINAAGVVVPWGPDVACVYRADATLGTYGADVLPDGGQWFDKWRPSIHMPRWASRIDLEIVGVRIERLQDLSRDDARAEGVQTLDRYENYIEHASAVGVGTGYAEIEVFRSLWDEINGARATWESNPWVWVVEFKRGRP